MHRIKSLSCCPMSNHAIPQHTIACLGNVKNIRNVCILAHVDHGKTTIADCLISSNGIISAKLVGELRYLDHTDEEQKRGITMKSSAISLTYNCPSRVLCQLPEASNKPKAESATGKIIHLINLIDSPGHVDFSADVSIALRACDGGLVVVDAVEGVCAQTFAVLRQAHENKVATTLVINKIDKLCLELHLSPTEAYERIQKIIEQVNVTVSELYTADLIARDYKNDTVKIRNNPGSSNDFESAATKSDVRAPKNVPATHTAYSWLNLRPDGEVPETHTSFSWRARRIRGQRKRNGKGPTPSATASGAKAKQSRAKGRGKGRGKRSATSAVQTGDQTLKFDEADEASKFFDPIKGNVVFASALHGWGFRLQQFAAVLYREKVFPPMYSRKAICQILWGEFYFNRSKGKIFSTCRNGELQPIFAQYVLGRIWRMYAKLQEGNIMAAIGVLKLDKGLALPLQKKTRSRFEKKKKKNKASSSHDIDSDFKSTLQYLCQRWLPVSEAILTMACACLPCPRDAQRERIECILPVASVDTARVNVGSVHSTKVSDAAIKNLRSNLLELRRNIEHCAVKTGPSPVETVALVTKMFAVPEHTLPPHDRLGMAITGGHCFLAFARVFSGTLRRDAHMFVLGAKYHPLQTEPIKPVTGLKLFVMMGRELRAVDEVPAGNVVAIGGLQAHVLRFATLCSTRSCVSLAHISMQAEPIVRVAIELTDLSDVPLLEKGLRLLNQSDPCVQVYIEDTGEHVLVTLGELHLKKCIDDLRTKFASGVAFTVSDPLVRFKETVIKSDEDSFEVAFKGSEPENFPASTSDHRSKDKHNNSGGGEDTNHAMKSPKRVASVVGKQRERLQRQRTANQKFELSIWAEAIPQVLVGVLEKHGEKLAALRRQVRFHGTAMPLDAEVSHELQDVLGTLPKRWSRYMDALWSVSISERMGPNLLVNLIPGCERLRMNWPWSISDPPKAAEATEGDLSGVVESNISAFVSGFQLACNRGPLCEEPMVGVCFILQYFGEVDDPEMESLGQVYGPLSGQLMSTTQSVCRAAFLAASPRLVEPMYSCQFMCHQMQLGSLYAVLESRRAKIQDEDSLEGTSVFKVKVLLPVLESLGLVEQMRKTTSGASSNAQMMLSGWQIVKDDPLINERTHVNEDEVEGVEIENLAIRIIKLVRKKKGLELIDKIVVNAEKQRTLSRKR